MSAQHMFELLRTRASSTPEAVAYTFLDGARQEPRSISWGQLDRQASRIARHMVDLGVRNEPVLLALPSGLRFIESLFACWYAGAIPVPISLPRHERLRQRVSAITADAGARFAIGTASAQKLVLPAMISSAAADVSRWIDADSAASSDGGGDFSAPPARLALLQYTSGSTGSPRGVMVTHGNLIHNSAMIANACRHGADDVVVAWLPLFHDMGLIGFIVQTAFVGMRCILMSPERFLMNPRLWLQAMSDYHATGTAAPNFAYDLCVDRVSVEQRATLDLRNWRNALNGSEPIRAATLNRFASAFAGCGFRRDAFSVCYGLAEATLFVTGPGGTRALTRRSSDGRLLADHESGGHVGCGTAFAGVELRITDPETCTAVPTGRIGEIWVRGDSVTDGYWNNEAATAAMFHGRLRLSGTAETPQAPHPEDSGVNWLRTGDLGFVDEAGELYITGRLRELIIIAGKNHFPNDIEHSVEAADPAIAPGGSVAFSVDVDGLERLVVCAEVRSDSIKHLNADLVCRNVARATAAENDIAPHAVVLLPAGALPRTSSGKLKRLATRGAYLDRTLERLDARLDECVTV
jgi:acyl-CoA synthetase (AMP-forming)/AMP-acid ligase II